MTTPQPHTPTPPASSTPPTPPGTAPLPQLVLTPLRPALIQGMAQKLPVLVRVQAPPVAAPGPTIQRPAHHIALALDRSGSMSGQPLAEAVRCAHHIVDRLLDHDHVAIVVFDHDADLLVPLGAASAAHRALAHRQLDAVYTGGNTNLYGAWQMAARALADGLATAQPAPALSRVLLLSDGNANSGLVDPVDIVPHVAQHSARGISTSTYGLGRDFNEDLMVQMAQHGQGNHYYGATANDLFEPFAEEFDLISLLCARQLRVSLGAAAGVDAGVEIELLNAYPVERRDGVSHIRMPDLPFDAEAWAVIELTIPAELTTPANGNPLIHLLHAAATATTPDGTPLPITDTLLALPCVSPAAWDTLLPDPATAERHAELHVATVLRQAREHAMAGDVSGALRLLRQAQDAHAGNPWSARVLDKLRALAESGDLHRFAKEAVYASRKMSSRLTAINEAAAMDLLTERAKPRFLRRRDLQGSADAAPDTPPGP